MGRPIDETGNIDYSYEGQKYGWLTVIYVYSKHTNEMRYENHKLQARSYKFALAKCVCGDIKEYYFKNLKYGISKSCGCHAWDNVHIKHGHTRHNTATSTYRIWHGMINRCTNPHYKKYKNYGGRGISVCERWYDFANFLTDMGERPGNLELDRINPNGNYEPSNCRWITHKEQCRNKCNTVYITYDGQQYTLPALAEKFGFRNGKILYNRIFSRGWSLEKAISVPTQVAYKWKNKGDGNGD